MTTIDLADKTTLDAIKALLGNANPTAADLTTVMNALKKIDAYFPISGGTDLTKITPIGMSKEEILTPGSINTWNTAFSVSGKGFLDEAMMGISLGGSPGDIRVKITIDGEQIYYSASNTHSFILLGIMNNYSNMNQYGVRNPTTYATGLGGTFSTIPVNSPSIHKIGLISRPIYFSTSVLVEYYTSIITPSDGLTLGIKGGLII